MSSEEKSPYYSVTCEVSEIHTKLGMGLHYIKVIGTMGNQKFVVFKNKEDVAESTGSIELANLVWDAYDKTKKEGINRNHEFIEVEK